MTDLASILAGVAQQRLKNDTGSIVADALGKGISAGASTLAANGGFGEPSLGQGIAVGLASGIGSSIGDAMKAAKADALADQAAEAQTQIALAQLTGGDPLSAAMGTDLLKGDKRAGNLIAATLLQDAATKQAARQEKLTENAISLTRSLANKGIMISPQEAASYLGGSGGGDFVKGEIPSFGRLLGSIAAQEGGARQKAVEQQKLNFAADIASESSRGRIEGQQQTEQKIAKEAAESILKNAEQFQKSAFDFATKPFNPAKINAEISSRIPNVEERKLARQELGTVTKLNSALKEIDNAMEKSFEAVKNVERIGGDFSEKQRILDATQTFITSLVDEFQPGPLDEKDFEIRVKPLLANFFDSPASEQAKKDAIKAAVVTNVDPFPTLESFLIVQRPTVESLKAGSKAAGIEQANTFQNDAASKYAEQAEQQLIAEGTIQPR